MTSWSSLNGSISGSSGFTCGLPSVDIIPPSASSSCSHTFPALMDYMPSYDQSHNKPFLSWAAFRCFRQSSGKGNCGGMKKMAPKGNGTIRNMALLERVSLWRWVWRFHICSRYLSPSISTTYCCLKDETCTPETWWFSTMLPSVCVSTYEFVWKLKDRLLKLVLPFHCRV